LRPLHSKEDLPPVVIDRRPGARKRVLWPGKVIWGKNLFSIDCVIRDLSETGARISIAKDEILPTRVELTDFKNGLSRDAEVIWIKLPIYGLKFTGSPRKYAP
jgi:hypothetical protein